MNELLKMIPPMIPANEIKGKMEILPHYDESIRNEDIATRLVRLNELYNIYVPLNMGAEIYSKIYLAMLRSIQKKETRLAVRQRIENGKMISAREENKNYYQGIIGGADSFTIIGDSGIGKSSAISRSLNLISQNGVIEINEPNYCKIAPCITVQCPFDCSVKGLLIQILREVDAAIGSEYSDQAIKMRSTVDMLIGSVSNVCLNHIGLLVVDEIQNVVKNRNGNNLISMLTQLINNSGISIAMVGTKECIDFFERVDYLSRRSLGLRYDSLEYGAEFRLVCQELFRYQYVKEKTELDEGILSWLYEHSRGVISNVVALIHDAQEIAILERTEVLDIQNLDRAFDERLQMMHGHIKSASKTKSATKVQHKMTLLPETKASKEVDLDATITELSRLAKEEKLDVVETLRNIVNIVELPRRREV